LRRTDASTCKMTPEFFEPGPYEILIGRGRRCTTHWGNQRFRSMVRSELSAYCAAADCKRSKSVIIGRVLEDIQRHSPQAGFIKKDVATGRWLSLTPAASRVAIAQAFRDALQDSYRSSKHFKQIKRSIAKKTQQCRNQQNTTVTPQVSPEGTEKPEFEGDFDDLDYIDFDPLPLLDSAPMEDEVIYNDAFRSLLAILGRENIDFQCDPFEPRPIADSRIQASTGHENKCKVPTFSSTSLSSEPVDRDIRAAMCA